MRNKLISALNYTFIMNLHFISQVSIKKKIHDVDFHMLIFILHG